MPSGGYRINAGRKKKSETMPKLESTKSGEVVEILDFGPDALELPKDPPEYLSEKAKEIYSNVYEWLKSIDCLKGIHSYTLEEYAICKARWLECEQMNSTHGMLLKDPNGKMIVSPYVAVGSKYLKEANDAWAKIHLIVVKTRKTTLVDTDEEIDPLEDLFKRKSDKK